MRWHFCRPNRNGWDDYLIGQRNAALRATEPEVDLAEASISEMEVSSSESGNSSAESLHLVTPMVRFLVSDAEDASSRSPDSPMQEAPLETADDPPLEEDESLDSWSDPDETLATIGDSVGLAVRLF
ncbi:hypothetical protein HO173_010098 [Letharia columbiana]|nr:uncharacterized protein HO173_010098 [Letharia columbiana]KAF6231796.1 hypothetical protein HO173_010098 [Letharia columbiana]